MILFIICLFLLIFFIIKIKEELKIIYKTNNIESENSNIYNESITNEILLPYEKKNYFLTMNELSFYRVLINHIENNKLKYVIIPRANLKEFIYVTEYDKSIHTIYWNKIKSKHVDFLICTENLHPIIAIELDDKSHQNYDRITRDDFVNNLFKHIKIKLIHIKASEFYNDETIKNLFNIENINTNS